MVVDDDPDQRELIRQILEPLGFTVLAAGDGAECLALTVDLKPDLFILDISMPGINGWDLARSLRERGQTGAILMLSANVGETPAAALRRGRARRGDGEAVRRAAPARPHRRPPRPRLAGRGAGADERQAGGGARPRPAASTSPSSCDSAASAMCAASRASSISSTPTTNNRAFVAEMRRHVRAFDFRRYTAALEEIGDD